MISKILFFIILALLFIASIEDFKTGEVKDIYLISVSMAILGILFSFYSNNILVNIKTNMQLTIIMFVSNYIVYFLTNIAKRYGWGGADVLILSALTCSIGFYIFYVLIGSTLLALIYSIVKSFYTKTKLMELSTRFIPFIFIITFFTTFLIF